MIVLVVFMSIVHANGDLGNQRCAFGWSGTNCSKDSNLIHHTQVHTSQSSTLDPIAEYNSMKAIDGVQNYSVDTCACCSVTDGPFFSWWQIDLAGKYLIRMLEMFGRSSGSISRLAYATVYAGNVSMDSDVSTGIRVFEVPRIAFAISHFIKELDPIIAQFFIVKLNLVKLELCEFRLFAAECAKGSFGNNCTHRCYCNDSKACNQVTGKCQSSGCLPGWKGEACDKVCDIHTFGNACNKTCHCVDDSPCFPINGTCFKGKCEHGWLLPTCSEAVNLLTRLSADVTTQMSSVVLNWTSDRAIDGRVGPDPDTCQCCSGTGISDLSWWRLDLGGLFPIKIITIYSGSRESFNRQLEGFSLFLTNSSSQQSTALNTDNNTKRVGLAFEVNDLNILARVLTIKRTGVLTICEVMITEGECRVGTYGDNCQYWCNCADNKPCLRENGRCQTSICKTGWRGDACDEQCPHDTFGDDCQENCFCALGTCTSNHGLCSTGCRQGYHGAHCNIVINSSRELITIGQHKSGTNVIIGASIGGSVAFLLVVSPLFVSLLYGREKEGIKMYLLPTLCQHMTLIMKL